MSKGNPRTKEEKAGQKKGADGFDLVLMESGFDEFPNLVEPEWGGEDQGGPKGDLNLRDDFIQDPQIDQFASDAGVECFSQRGEEDFTDMFPEGVADCE